MCIFNHGETWRQVNYFRLCVSLFLQPLRTTHVCACPDLRRPSIPLSLWLYVHPSICPLARLSIWPCAYPPIFVCKWHGRWTRKRPDLLHYTSTTGLTYRITCCTYIYLQLLLGIEGFILFFNWIITSKVKKIIATYRDKSEIFWLPPAILVS